MSAALNEDDRVTLMAYVDGEMPEAELIAFEARVAHDEALFDAVVRERALRSGLNAHYDAVLDESVPAGLLDLLGVSSDASDEPAAADDPAPPARAPAPGKLELVPAVEAPTRPPPLPQQQQQQPPPRASGMAAWQAWGGMAACLVLGVVLGSLTPTPTSASNTLALAVDDQGALTAAGPLRDALEQRVGGPLKSGANGVAIGFSFRDKAQDYCRTFAVDTALGIACKSNGQWAVANLEHAPAVAETPAAAAGSEAYRSAASALSPTLLLQVDALRDGDTFDAAAEAAARAKGWQR